MYFLLIKSIIIRPFTLKRMSAFGNWDVCACSCCLWSIVDDFFWGVKCNDFFQFSYTCMFYCLTAWYVIQSLHALYINYVQSRYDLRNYSFAQFSWKCFAVDQGQKEKKKKGVCVCDSTVYFKYLNTEIGNPRQYWNT